MKYVGKLLLVTSALIILSAECMCQLSGCEPLHYSLTMKTSGVICS